jgi:hypothetical protein
MEVNQSAPVDVDWEAVGRRMDEAPGENEPTEDELRRAAGEGPGPDDAPALRYPLWDIDAPEKLARVRRYAADIDRGRPIRFVRKETALCGPVSESRAGMARGRIGPGSDATRWQAQQSRGLTRGGDVDKSTFAG